VSRKKQLAIYVVILFALAAWMTVRRAADNAPVRGQFDRIRGGETLDSVVATMGTPLVEHKLTDGSDRLSVAWAGRDGIMWLTFDAQKRVCNKEFFKQDPSSLFDRVLNWFGL
jgi:hypothetical protein